MRYKMLAFAGIAAVIAAAILLTSSAPRQETPFAFQTETSLAPSGHSPQGEITSTTVRQERRSLLEEGAERSEAGDVVPITISVASTTYPLSVNPDSTVYDAMLVLASTTPFHFHAKPYPGMGYFVDEINGVKNSLKKYWILYMNGKPAVAGVSSVVVQSGDSIDWRYMDAIN